MWLFHRANVSELKNTFIHFDVLNENACKRQFFSTCIIFFYMKNYINVILLALGLKYNASSNKWFSCRKVD